MILLDTNVLGRMTDSADPHCSAARQAVHTSQWLQFFQRRFVFLPDREELFTCWHGLVRSQGIKGVRSHDVRLVAAMHTFGITRILTFNRADFKDFAITVLDPATL